MAVRKSVRLLTVVLLIACTSQKGAATSAVVSPASTPVQSVPSAAPSGEPLSLSAVQRLTAGVGYIAAWHGGGPGLARTSDGGATWQTVSVPAAYLTALRFIDAYVGWAAGMIDRPMAGVACQQAAPTAMDPCYGVVLRTQDGGKTWRKSLLLPYYGTYSYPVQQIQAIDGQIAWALILDCDPASSARGPYGCASDVRKTTDGGATWAIQATGYIVGIRFATSSRGWMTVSDADGSYEVRVTSDGGSTWTTRLRTTSGSVVGLDAANADTAWVMTQDGGYCTSTTCTNYELFRSTDGGITWSSLGNPKHTPGTNCIGGHLVGPLFASPVSGWLAENTGAGGARATTGLLQTDDGGRTWRCLAAPTQSSAVSAADQQHVWVTTTQPADGTSAMFSTDDGGVSWRELNLSGLVPAPSHQ